MKIKGLTIIAIISFGIVYWINFIDFKFAGMISGKAEKIESLIENLCMSYLAGYMFYFLNIYLVERREKKLILPFVSRNVINLIVNNYSIICCLRNNQKIDFDNFPSKSEFNVLLEKVNPKDKIPFYYKNENWIFLFNKRQDSTLNYINRIFLSGKHIDEELRKILLEMQFSQYLQDNYAFNSDELKDKNLSTYSLIFYNHFQLIKELHTYYEKNLKTYYMGSIAKSIMKRIRTKASL
ncbi:hypothetical protein [Flavobacterium sp. GT3R68]|uniref:hypothetical protein n=1 Tax=Flavobacterium sp. GT3R68 TaxID=2594437 RepID=UPI000F89709D|nr:hypothetical protein [Flavobacterium sp. GT3R68]RTY85832.1 hypothetical protein EKL32_28290 [Flavobacterium sp. GSN2]TRW89360.1 hypothetical protein FNW07_13385 [Flavobacterium sp. GT3R68]